MASIKRRPNGRWRARYRDAAGREYSRHFQRKSDAQRWIDEVTTSIVTGQYADPNAGKMTFREYAEGWRAMQVHRATSVAHVESRLRLHAYPTLGDRPLNSIYPGDIQALVKALTLGDPQAGRKPLAASSVGVWHGIVSSVFASAVRDRRIALNPCAGTKLPKPPRKRVVPPTTEQVRTLAERMPPELRLLIPFDAGTGLRQGECFGLTVDRIDLARRRLHVDRQLVGLTADNGPVFGPPKTDASLRSVPLPDVVVATVRAQLEAFPPGPDGLVFALDGRPLTRQNFGRVWRPAARAAGIPVGTGMHSLRHYYASLLIQHGESVKTVQERLGHATAAETLDTYSHLWPDSDDRTREAVNAVLVGFPL